MGALPVLGKMQIGPPVQSLLVSTFHLLHLHLPPLSFASCKYLRSSSSSFPLTLCHPPFILPSPTLPFRHLIPSKPPSSFFLDKRKGGKETVYLIWAPDHPHPATHQPSLPSTSRPFSRTGSTKTTKQVQLGPCGRKAKDFVLGSVNN